MEKFRKMRIQSRLLDRDGVKGKAIQRTHERPPEKKTGGLLEIQERLFVHPEDEFSIPSGGDDNGDDSGGWAMPATYCENVFPDVNTEIKKGTIPKNRMTPEQLAESDYVQRLAQARINTFYGAVVAKKQLSSIENKLGKFTI